MLQSVSWSKTDSTLIIKWSNRAQSKATLQGCTITTNDNVDCKNNLTLIEKDDRSYISKLVSFYSFIV